MKKAENFEGQKMLVLPQQTVESLKNNPLTKNLYITDVGYFPVAKNHYIERIKGSPQNILIYCINGSGWIETNGKRDNINSNQYYIIPENTTHAYAADTNDPWTIYWIHFTGPYSQYFMRTQTFPLTLTLTATARIQERIQLFEEIFVNLDSGYSSDNLEYSSILLMQLLGTLKYLVQFRKIKEINQEDFVSCAIRFMKENMRKKISLKEIATSCNLSVSHFCLIFKKKTSHSPLDHLTIIRIQEACSLLSFTSLKINEIAPKVGYEDPYYFTRVFTRLMGEPPSAYRKRNK